MSTCRDGVVSRRRCQKDEAGAVVARRSPAELVARSDGEHVDLVMVESDDGPTCRVALVHRRPVSSRLAFPARFNINFTTYHRITGGEFRYSRADSKRVVGT